MPTPAEKWPDEFLVGMRQLGDPLADATVDALFRRGDIANVNALLTTLVRNDLVPDGGTDPDIRAYLQATASVPGIDHDLVAAAQDLFAKNGPLALFTLLCASLPECYTMKKGVNVLWITQRLQEHVLRRLLETAHMVTRVMTPGGLAPGGAGLRTASKVRLMHAAIRRLILHGQHSKRTADVGTLAEAMSATAWDTSHLGVPINQMDLAYTLLTFSYVMPRSLDKLGMRLTDREREGFIHTWNVIGAVMGIRSDLLPASYAEAEWLFARIKELEGGASEAGQRMTAAVLRCMQDAIPGTVADFLPLLLITELLDERTRQWLGITPPGPVSAAAQMFLMANVRNSNWITRGADKYVVVSPPIAKWVAGYVTVFLTNLGQPKGWQRQMFTIPDEVARHWELPKTR
ncbi:MAG TPA: oxygenase MpaB family protein [Gemmatimonadaceae bacterium]|nr:oxygenase MpaB family protein [Gemmatimonadaceae bacterium]